MSVKIFCAMLLVLLLGVPSPALAQQPAPASPQPTTLAARPSALTILVLEGENAVNDIRVPGNAMIVVEVRDENSKPVEGADVTFELPGNGAGGSFANQQRRFMTRTNVQGQAAATYTPNNQSGRFDIQVTAAQGGRSGSAMIRQTNSMRASEIEKSGTTGRKFRWWKVALIAGAGAGIVVGILLATRSSTPTVTVTPGRPTFGAPTP